MELFKIVALLCQLNGAGADSYSMVKDAEQRQIDCQKYFIKCINDPSPTHTTISTCIIKRTRN